MINLNRNLTLTISKTGFVHDFVDENAMSGFGKILQKSLFLLESVRDLTFRLFKDNSTNTCYIRQVPSKHTLK